MSLKKKFLAWERTLAKTEIIYPKNVGAQVAMNLIYNWMVIENSKYQLNNPADLANLVQ